MTVITFYLKGGVLVNGFQPMQEGGVAPTDAAFSTVTGWQVGANPVGEQSELRPNTKQSNTTFIVQTVPTALGTGANANAFRTADPYSVSFVAGNWTLSAVFRSTVSMATGQQVRLRWRVFASINADGTGARELTSGVVLSNSVAGTGNTTTNFSPAIATWSAGAIMLNGEYLFFALAMEVMAASGTGGTRDATFRENTDSKIVTPDFSVSVPSLLIPTDIRTRSLIRR